MNIIVRTYGDKCYCRPDTSWEREDKDLFSPDSVSSYLYTPVIFARISKAGKCVGLKFAERYYDSVGYGMLLYAGDLFDGSPMSYAAASCLDHTSFLPFPMYGKQAIDGREDRFILRKDGQEIFGTAEGDSGIIENAISGTSGLVSLRIGDMIAIELAEPEMLVSKKDLPAGKSVEISGEYGGKEVFRFNIIF